MRKTIISIIVGIVLINLVFAIYPGECESIKFPNKDEVNFTLISNTSSLEGFNWSKEGYDITYCFPTYLESGNYSFEWSNYQDSLSEPTVVHHYSSGGGGSSRTIYKDRNITEYVEVDKYIDREVYKEDEEETRQNKKILLFIIIGGLLIVFIIIFIVFTLIKGRKNQE